MARYLNSFGTEKPAFVFNPRLVSSLWHFFATKSVKGKEQVYLNPYEQLSIVQQQETERTAILQIRKENRDDSDIFFLFLN